MHWNVLKNKLPCSGSNCVVGRVHNNQTKVGIYTFYLNGNNPVWESKRGERYTALIHDHWCLVSDIIAEVECKVEDAIRSEIEFNRSVHRCLNNL
jgi:hypothetical protein